MHRRNLLEALGRYQIRFPAEQVISTRFIDFIQREPRCFERDCWRGHVTGSAWLVDPPGTAVLLTHHKKLDAWLQLGGHSDGNADVQAVAMREAREESGLAISLLSAEILDIDVHEIPARRTEPAHFHYDVRFAIQAEGTDFVVSRESKALAWVGMDNLPGFTSESSIQRMRDKWLAGSGHRP